MRLTTEQAEIVAKARNDAFIATEFYQRVYGKGGRLPDRHGMTVEQLLSAATIGDAMNAVNLVHDLVFFKGHPDFGNQGGHEMLREPGTDKVLWSRRFTGNPILKQLFHQAQKLVNRAGHDKRMELINGES